MLTLIQQALLALGTGGITAIAGLGIVQIYRGSGVLNFAHGAVALVSAQVFATTWADHGWPLAAAIGCALLTGACLGLLTFMLVMHPLRAAPQLVRIIATLGVMQVLQQGSAVVFGNEPRFVGSFLPTGSIKLGSIAVPTAGLTISAIALMGASGLAAVMNATRFGLSTRAVAQSELVVRSLGRSPDVLAAANWAIGGLLAGLAGVLVVSIGGVAISSLLLLAVPAFASAVIGGFTSFAGTTIGAFVIAAGQAVLTFQSVAHGWPPSLPASLPFLVVVVVLVLRSTSLPPRDHVAPHLPRLGLTRPPSWSGPLLLAATSVALVAPSGLANALITTVITAVIGLSLVVCTGLTGQISLAQYAIAGIGGLVAARLSGAGWPFLLCLAGGVVTSAVAGMLFALPAMRTRGPALAVVTIGLGLAVQQGILSDKRITGGFNGATPVERPSIFGIPVNATEFPGRYAALCLFTFGVLAIAVRALGRSHLGKQMIAVRNHERAAAAMGIAVQRIKVLSFLLASGIAGIGGVLIAFRFDAVQYSQYSFTASLQVVTLAVIGGIGFVLGPLLGALATPSGVVSWALSGVGNADEWLVLTSGAALVITLIKAPDGILGTLVRRWPHRPDLTSTRRTVAPVVLRPAPLTVRDVTVKFGDNVALTDVSLDVTPGQVTGLIGANGAGKTTLIDAVSGFVTLDGGSIRLGTVELSGLSPTVRARLGVARCFQSIDLFHDLTVHENLLVAAGRPPARGIASRLRAPRQRNVPDPALRVLEELGLTELTDSWPAQLSHGQRRLTGVARALVGQPAVLLLDEPAAGLDRAETARLGEVVRRVAAMGLGVLIVEHDVDLVVRISDEVVALDLGRRIFSGRPRDALTDPRVRTSYLGVEEPAHTPSVATAAAVSRSHLQPGGQTTDLLA